MKNLKNTALSTVATLALVTLAFAQSATGTMSTSNYQAKLQELKTTLKTDTDQYNADRKAWKKALLGTDATVIASAKAKVTADRIKVNADQKAIDDLKKAHQKEIGMKDKSKDDNKDGKMDKKDKNGKDMETNDDKKMMGTGTKATSTMR